jgi:hypothetical protein
MQSVMWGVAHNASQHHVDLHHLLRDGDHVKKDGMGGHVEGRDETNKHCLFGNLKESYNFMGLGLSQITSGS